MKNFFTNYQKAIISFVPELVGIFKSIVSQSIKDNLLRKRFLTMLLSNFFNVLDKTKYMVISQPDNILSKNSAYFYVFEKCERNITKSELRNVLDCAEKFVGADNMDPITLENKAKILEKYKDLGLIQLKYIEDNKIDIITLENCKLVIRVSNHDFHEIKQQNAAKNYLARKNTVEDIHFLNVEEAEKRFNIEFDGYGFAKSGKERIKRDFENKMKENDFSVDEITLALSTIDSIFDKGKG